MAPAKRPKTPRRRAQAQKTGDDAPYTIVAEESGRSDTAMGRPPIIFNDDDWADFEQLCGFQCTLPELAAWFGCSEDTIERRVQEKYGQTFAEVFQEKRLAGKASLRRAQFANAIGGNPTMQIWLGKQLLGQKDKHEISGDRENPLSLEHSGEVTTRVKIVNVAIPANGFRPGEHAEDDDGLGDDDEGTGPAPSKPDATRRASKLAGQGAANRAGGKREAVERPARQPHKRLPR